jgi:hypothetical protein
MDGVKDGTIQIKSAEIPRFLYASDQVFNPNDRARGLLRGEVLVRVSLHNLVLQYVDNELVRPSAYFSPVPVPPQQASAPRALRSAKLPYMA